MVFSSLPAYLDPSNWQQVQPNNRAGSSNGPTTHHLTPPPPPPPGSGGNSIRPGSMSDRARLANIPMPETALKCPRCESTNTKFCYFNNYSLSQPRHFCKTCRRYWTCGGALRSVPVGGSCRRNKRSSSKAKSPNSTQTTSSGSINNISSGNEILGLGPQNIPPLRFPNFHQLTDFSNNEHQIGINYPHDLTFNIGNSLSGGGGGGGGLIGNSLFGMDTWRLQPPPQFSFMGGGGGGGLMDHNSSSNLGLYPNFESGGGVEYGGGAFRPKLMSSATSEAITTATTQLALVKMEDNNIKNHHHHQELNLSRQCLGISNNIQVAAGNDQYGNWTSSTPLPAWTELSSFSSSSTSNPL